MNPPSNRAVMHRDITCRICGSALNGAWDPHPGHSCAPADGTYSICMTCGELSIFVVLLGEIIGLREPTLAEVEFFHRHFARYARYATEIRLARARGDAFPPFE